MKNKDVPDKTCSNCLNFVDIHKGYKLKKQREKEKRRLEKKRYLDEKKELQNKKK